MSIPLKFAVTVLASLFFLFLNTADLVAQTTTDTETPKLEQIRANFGFGKKVAGTYFMRAPSLPGINILWMFHADGTMVSSSSNDFGGGNPAAIGLYTPAYGNWIRTGPRQVLVRHLQFHHSEDGAHDFIELVEVTFTFTSDFQEFTTEGFHAADYGIDQDPTDPAAVPAFGSLDIPLPIVAKRLPVP